MRLWGARLPVIACLALCIAQMASTASADSELVDQLVAKFEAIAFGNDFGAGFPHVTKWARPLRFSEL